MAKDNPAEQAGTIVQGKAAYHCRLAPIRLGEFDIGSVLYHGRYFNLLEEVREDFMRSIGSPYPDLVRDGMHLAITESRQNFLSPIRYGDAIEARLNFSEIRRTSFVAQYELLSAAGAAVHRAQTKHVCIQLQTGNEFKIVALPEKLAAGLSRYGG